MIPRWDLGVGGGGGGPEQRERVVLFGILTWKVVGKEFYAKQTLLYSIKKF